MIGPASPAASARQRTAAAGPGPALRLAPAVVVSESDGHKLETSSVEVESLGKNSEWKFQSVGSKELEMEELEMEVICRRSP